MPSGVQELKSQDKLPGLTLKRKLTYAKYAKFFHK